MNAQTPRIPPGGRAEIGALNALIAKVAGRATGTGKPLNIFATLGRHRRLFLPWLFFAGRLMPGGKLPRQDTELLILRTASNCGCEYERGHHVRLGRRAGLTDEQIEQTAQHEPSKTAFTERQRNLLTAADELHKSRALTERTWQQLRPLLSDAELIELCMLVGHYEMLAMTLNTLQVQPEA